MLDVTFLNTDIIILFRVVLAVVLACIPGVERELTGKFAGLRTHILVCVGACVFTILSIYGFQSTMDTAGVITQNDPARIAAQIITGIGFIGAGTVMRHGSSVSGITTAATLWVCAAIGMCCGCGEYLTAVITSLATLIVLIVIRRLEKTFLAKRKKISVSYEINISSKISECDSIQNVFENNFQKIYKLNKKILNSDELHFCASIVSKKSIKEIYEIFNKIENIDSIEIRERYE